MLLKFSYYFLCTVGNLSDFESQMAVSNGYRDSNVQMLHSKQLKIACQSWVYEKKYNLLTKIYRKPYEKLLKYLFFFTKIFFCLPL